ncbi:MAG: hypothetical protein GY809_05595 [Planctomycetes bacterium]|nr:hypothetical protein [Planctomycetota bacterium]
MYTIDLLQGTGRPSRPKPIRTIIATSLCVALGALSVWGYLEYQDLNAQVNIEQNRCVDYTKRIEALDTTQAFLAGIESQQEQLTAQQSDISTVLQEHKQWSNILVRLARHVPDHMAISDMMIKQNTQEISAKTKIHYYTLVVGAVTESDPQAVERFVQAIKSDKILEEQLESVRISHQKTRLIEKQRHLQFSIECRFKT